MKTIKLFNLVASFLFLNQGLFAQTSYLKLRSGYGFEITKQNLRGFSATPVNTFLSESIDASLGSGLNVGLAYGYQISQNISVELDAHYLIGTSHSFELRDFSPTTKTSLRSRMFRVIPSVVFSFDYRSLKPYMRMGITMASGNVYYNVTQDDTEQEYRLYGGVGVGVSSAFGTMFKIGKLGYFVEVDFMNYSFSPTKGEQSKFIDNGVDKLPDLVTSQKEIEFVDEFKEGDFNNDGSKPTKLLKSTYPFGSLGINVGLIINL